MKQLYGHPTLPKATKLPGAPQPTRGAIGELNYIVVRIRGGRLQ